MTRLRIVEELDNIENVTELLYQCYPFFQIDDPILNSDPRHKKIKLEELSFLVSLQNATKHYILVEKEDTLVGFAALNMLAIQGFYSLSWVAVPESHRGQGIAKRMVWEAIRFSRAKGQEVVLSTEIPDFYANLGFSISNEFKPGWYLMSTSSMKVE
jgi:ribosomal protein S18 acetylase RimI-like enzyme